MPNIHTLDPKRRSSKEKELVNDLTDIVDKYIGEIPLISFLGVIDLVKMSVFDRQKEIHTDGED